ncbi:MAG: AAA family ATPase [Alphaproteobacteria bacterium]|nr:AAA family ATPase [Alphaproteobacteria bacterium]
MSEWLAKLGLEKYLEVFAENEIDFDAARLLDEGDLKELGLPMGPRKKFLSAIASIATLAGETRGVGDQTARSPDASRRQVTVLFADISGFTAMSSGLDAEQTHARLNGFFAVVDAIVRRYGGMVDKHIGDAVMAVFGAPVAHTNDPERAMRAAGDIHEGVLGLEPPIEVHIGVAAGQVVASTTGSAAYAEYTITGDSVNLAARLTDLAQAGETLVSASVQRSLGEQFEGDCLGERPIAGLLEPVTVWRLRGLRKPHAGALHPFVGRQRELHRFEGAVRHCLSHDVGETLVVRGEAGIGKTRLLAEFERVASEQGFRCHTGLVLDFGIGKGQDAVSSFVRSLLEISPGGGKAERTKAANDAVSAGLLPPDQRVYLNDLLDLEQPPALRGLYDAMDNDTRNKGKRETVTALVRSLSQQTPLLLKIEDLHWADPVVLSRVALLAKVVGDCRAILVLTTRLAADPLDANWRADADGTPVSSIDLGAMEKSEALDLARTFAGLDQVLVDTCIERAGGNPLFLEQLLRNADELQGGEVPGTLQGIIQARLDALPPRDKAALQAASVLGQRFSGAALAVLLRYDDYRPDILLAQALIRPAGNDYYFAHALIRDGVYGSLLSDQRVELHIRAAGYFKEFDPSLHAAHLDAGKVPGAAAAYLTAAQRQHDAFRNDVALRLVDRALELDCPAEVHFNLTCFQGDLLRELGQTERSISAFRLAQVAATTDRQICRVNTGLAEGLRIIDRRDEGLAALERAEVVAQRLDSREALARIHYLRGGIYFSMGDFERCLSEHGQALEYAKQAVSPEAEARALSGLGDAWYMDGRMQTAYKFFDRCIEVAGRHGLAAIEASNLIMRGVINLYLAKPEAGSRDVAAAINMSLAIGDQRAFAVAKGVAAQFDIEAGDGVRAESLAVEMFEASQHIGAKLFSCDAKGLLARALLVQGRRAEAELEIRSAIALAREAGMAFMGPTCLGILALLTDDAECAGQALAEGECLLRAGAVSHNYLDFYEYAIEASLRRGGWDEADRYAAAMEAYWAPEPIPVCDFVISRGRLLAAIGRGQYDQTTVDDLRQIQDRAKQMGKLTALPAIDAMLASIKPS